MAESISVVGADIEEDILIRRPGRFRVPKWVKVAVRWCLGMVNKVAEGAAVAFGVFLVGFAGFVIVAPDTAKELIFNQNLSIDPPEVQVDVSLGDELTEILKEIRDGLK